MLLQPNPKATLLTCCGGKWSAKRMLEKRAACFFARMLTLPDPVYRTLDK